MKIYLAGSCASDCRTEMTKIGKELRNAGFTVYCPFELKIDNAWDYTQEEWAQKVFDNDVTAIDSCDIFVMISPGRVSTAGTNWEQGYAYAKGKTIIVFQTTPAPASLMTYCGCDNYFVMQPGEDALTIAQSVKTIMDNYLDGVKLPCAVTLT